MFLARAIAASRRRIFDPLSLSPALWLDASDSSTLFDATTGGSLVAADGAVARWEDKSGNGRHATQGTSGNRPVRKTSIQNDRDTLRFNGSSHSLVMASVEFFNSSHPWTVFIVSSRSGSGDQTVFGNRNLNFGRFLRLTNTGAQYIHAGFAASVTTLTENHSGFAIWSINAESANNTLRKNGAGAVNSSGSGYTASTNPLAIGQDGRGAEYHQGDIAEILVFPTTLSTADRQKVEQYLSNKYAIALA